MNLKQRKTCKVSCIIPAFNEAKRIGGVLRIIRDHALIDEIIIVDDGSSDGTCDVVKRFEKMRLVRISPNQGKTAAVMTGVALAKNEYIMLLDSDLMHLKRSDITRLLLPVLSREADVSISLRKNSLPLFRLIGIDFISGERVMQKELLQDLFLSKRGKLAGFGLESYINSAIVRDGLKIAVVDWQDVSHARKAEKMGFVKGSFADVLMFLEILKVSGVFKLVHQMIKMRSAKIKSSK